MNNRSDQSARDLESEAAATRARLSGHLDGLVSGLTPGHIIDEVMTYSRRGGTDFLRGLTHAAAANPIPTLLIGAGCAMFLSGRLRLSGDDGGKDKRDAPATEWQRSMRGPGDNRAERETAMSGLKAGASSVGSAVSSAVGDGTAAVQSAAASAAAHLRDGATGAASQVAEGVRAVGETVGDYASALKEKAGEQGGRARQQATLLNVRTAALFEEQPLLVAAGGLAIGAFIAAVLPRTRLEDTYLGDTSDAVKEAVGHVASEQYREAKEAAGQVVERIKDEAIDEDLSETARAAVRDIGDKLKTVAEAANEAIGQEAGKIVRRNMASSGGSTSTKP